MCADITGKARYVKCKSKSRSHVEIHQGFRDDKRSQKQNKNRKNRHTVGCKTNEDISKSSTMTNITRPTLNIESMYLMKKEDAYDPMAEFMRERADVVRILRHKRNESKYDI